MSKIFKPRRGRASTMAGTKASTVLAAGEFFVELPDTGVGTGPCKIKMGDGSTTYPNLPYALGDEVSDVTITADSSTSASAALANVVSGKSLGQLIGSLKQACSKNADAIATLNDEMTNNILKTIYRKQAISISNNDSINDCNDATDPQYIYIIRNSALNRPNIDLEFQMFILQSIWNNNVFQLGITPGCTVIVLRRYIIASDWTAWFKVSLISAT